METALKVKKTDTDLSVLDSLSIDRLFTICDWQDIAHSPWKAEYPYEPRVRFQIVHSAAKIYIRYTVEEEYVKAQYVRPNENVWEDSCVEFFISLDDRQTYYNFEFNVLGTGLIGYGIANKAERKRLDPMLVEQIDTFTQVFKVNGKKSWDITLAIPKTIFSGQLKSGVPVAANFYKCGDKLPEPHFMAWNNINSPTPNFHQPQFFGEVIFE